MKTPEREIDQAVEPKTINATSAYWAERATELSSRLEQFNQVSEHDPTGVKETVLLSLSIATALDAQGAFFEIGSIPHSPPASDGLNRNLFYVGGREYSFARGLYPEYDAYRDYFDAEIEYNEAKAKGILDAPAPQFDPALYALYVYRAEEAIRIARSLSM